MAHALVTVFENTSCFQNAKNNMKLLEEIQYIDKRLVRRLRTAVKNNSQIYKAYGVPRRVEELISEFDV